MKDPDLLEQLGSELRQDEELFRKFLQEGTAPAADPHLPASLRAPLGAAERRAIVDGVLSRSPAVPDSPPRRNVIVPRFAALAAAALVAGSAALWLSSGADVPPIARYEVDLSGGVALARSSSAPVELQAGREVTFTLRPARDVAGEVAARVFFASPVPAELQAQVEAASSGALRVRVRLPEPLYPGATLSVLVGRKSELTPAHVTQAQPAGPGWQRFDWKL